MRYSMVWKSVLGILLFLFAWEEERSQTAVAAQIPPAPLKNKTSSPPWPFEHPQGRYRVLFPEDWKEFPPLSPTAETRTFRNAENSSQLSIRCLAEYLTFHELRKRMGYRIEDLRKRGVDVPNFSDRNIGKGAVKALYTTWVTLNGLARSEINLLIIPGAMVEISYVCKLNDRGTVLRIMDTMEFLVPEGTELIKCPESWPRTGFINEYLGLRWKGQKEEEQCGWAAYEFAATYLGRTLPSVHPSGVEKLWSVDTAGFRKVPNTSDNLPSAGSLLLWRKSARSVTGHIAVVLNAYSKNRWVRIIDCNGDGKRSGQIRDVSLRNRDIVGWLVRE